MPPKRGVRSTRTDIVGRLPPELGEMIFGYLGPEELCHSTMVSTTWMNLANSCRLWRRALPAIPHPSPECEEELCILARIYKKDWKVRNNWRSDKYRESVHGVASVTAREELLVADSGRLVLVKDGRAVHAFPLDGTDRLYTLRELEDVGSNANVSIGGMTGVWRKGVAGCALVVTSVANLIAIYSFDSEADNLALIMVLAFTIRQTHFHNFWEQRVWTPFEENEDFDNFVTTKLDTDYAACSPVMTGTDLGTPVVCLKIFNRFNYDEFIVMWDIERCRVVLWLEMACRVRQMEECWDSSGLCVTRGDSRIACYDLRGTLTDLFHLYPSNWLIGSLVIDNASVVLGAVTEYEVGGVDLVVWRRGGVAAEEDHWPLEPAERVLHLDRVAQFARVELRAAPDGLRAVVLVADTRFSRSLLLLLTTSKASPVRLAATFEIDTPRSKFVLDFIPLSLLSVVNSTSFRLYDLTTKQASGAWKAPGDDYDVVYADKFKLVMFNRATKEITVRNYQYGRSAKRRNKDKVVL